MITIFVIALFHGLQAVVTTVVHAVVHGVSYLFVPNVARYGACGDCDFDTWQLAQERKHYDEACAEKARLEAEQEAARKAMYPWANACTTCGEFNAYHTEWPDGSRTCPDYVLRGAS